MWGEEACGVGKPESVFVCTYGTYGGGALVHVTGGDATSRTLCTKRRNIPTEKLAAFRTSCTCLFDLRTVESRLLMGKKGDEYGEGKIKGGLAGEPCLL